MEEQIQIAPIDPSVYLQPWPLWLMVAVGIAGLLLLAALVALLVAWVRKLSAPPPVSPKQRALNSLADLGEQVQNSDPYELSIQVSGVLRRYITAVYELPATSQTSPEFLATAATNPGFSEADRELLKGFLEKADLIKFARLQASAADSEALLGQALDFVNRKEVQA